MYQIEVFHYARIPLELNKDDVREVAILAESGVEPIIYEALAAAALSMGLEPTIVLMLERPAHGLEPTSVVASSFLGADLIISATTTSAIAHTRAGREAFRRGKKFVGMPQITVDTLTRGAATADYQQVGRITRKVAEILTAGDSTRVTTEMGTDITFSVRGRKCLELAGVYKPGSIACFPDGEAPLAPVEGTARGRFVVDSSMHGIGRLLHPITIIVESGRATEITGGPQADQLGRLLKDFGDANSLSIGEFAIGTNNKARACLNVAEDKKRLGTVHIGLGSNLSIGGSVESATHVDGVISNATVEVDGRVIMQQGKMLIQ